MKPRWAYIVVLLAMLLGNGSFALVPAAASGTRSLTILYTNNTMGYLEPCRH